MARVREANYLSVGVALAATILVAVFGDRLLAVFDPAFATARDALIIMMGSQLILALAGPASQILSILGRQRIVLGMCLAALALLCAANATLVPIYGLRGAAAAILMSITFWSVSLAYALARSTGLRSYLDIGAAGRGGGIRQRV
jgi:O-antigen/teichoic acid export membrane protein